MQNTAEQAFKVFDEFDSKGEAFNVYQYMFKLGSTAIGKLALNQDLHHFSSIHTPLHDLVRSVGENLELNKKVCTMGDLYSHMPWGAPKQLKNNKLHVKQMIDDAVEQITGGKQLEDLPISDAASKASCIVDFLARATDEKGEKLPEKYRSTTTLVAEFQKRLLQELVDHGVTNDTVWDPDLADELSFLNILIREVQRFHRPSYQPGRTALAYVILPGGYRVPKDSVMIIAIHHIHNNPKIWDDPSRFNADRWNTDKVKNRPNASSYVPFAAGQRMCIGFNFALQEVKVIISMLIYRY